MGAASDTSTLKHESERTRKRVKQIAFYEVFFLGVALNTRRACVLACFKAA